MELTLFSLHFVLVTAKANPMADIGVDFDALNRKERRMEKPTVNPSVSPITMGKAMGSGSRMGRGGAASLRPPSNPGMSGAAMGMGMGGAPGYRPMGMGINPGTAQRPPDGGYIFTPMMGPGGRYPQPLPYGGYR